MRSEAAKHAPVGQFSRYDGPQVGHGGRKTIDPSERGGNHGGDRKGTQVCEGAIVHPGGWNAGSRAHPIDSRYVNWREAASAKESPKKRTLRISIADHRKAIDYIETVLQYPKRLVTICNCGTR
jgi:hypothetical protein